MELLRKPPFPLSLEYSDLPITTDVVATFASTRNTFVEDVEATTDGAGDVTFELGERFSRYDGEYSLIVYEGTSDAKEDVLLMDTVRVVRPYIDALELAPTGKEDEYLKLERTARIMIDNIVGGFYYTLATYDLVGNGTDMLVVGDRVNKLLRVTENNVLMYEIDGEDNNATYALNTDKTAVILFQDQEADIYQGRPVLPTGASSDSYENPLFRSVTFPSGYDYVIQVESGWPMVPQDIKEATTILLEDMACGNPNYWAKYVREYETKDYRVDFHRPSFAGTGNVIVDQILARYIGDTLYNNIRVL